MKEQINNHTALPWKADSGEHTEPYMPITIKSGTRAICTIDIDDAPVLDYNAEQDANAVFLEIACNNFYKMKAMLESHLPWLIELHGTDSIVGIKQLEQLLKTLDK